MNLLVVKQKLRLFECDQRQRPLGPGSGSQTDLSKHKSSVEGVGDAATLDGRDGGGATAEIACEEVAMFSISTCGDPNPGRRTAAYRRWSPEVWSPPPASRENPSRGQYAS